MALLIPWARKSESIGKHVVRVFTVQISGWLGLSVGLVFIRQRGANSNTSSRHVGIGQTQGNESRSVLVRTQLSRNYTAHTFTRREDKGEGGV